LKTHATRRICWAAFSEGNEYCTDFNAILYTASNRLWVGTQLAMIDRKILELEMLQFSILGHAGIAASAPCGSGCANVIQAARMLLQEIWERFQVCVGRCISVSESVGGIACVSDAHVGHCGHDAEGHKTGVLGSDQTTRKGTERRTGQRITKVDCMVSAGTTSRSFASSLSPSPGTHYNSVRPELT